MAIAGLSVFCLAVTPIAVHVASASAQSNTATEAPSSTAALPCFTNRTATTLPSIDTPAMGAQVRVSVEVASTTRLRLDDNGNLDAVATNTGCAPKDTDDFVVEHSGNETPASPEIITSALTCKATGSWEDTTHWHPCHIRQSSTIRE
jgi:hypothetical protein